jgi:hypothetical protein
MRSCNTQKSRQIKDNVTASVKWISITVMLLMFLTPASAFGQMGSGSTYSDVWLDNNSGNALRVIGCGITDESYNSYNHEAWVNTTLTSSGGQLATANSGGSSYARADAILPSEDGEFSFESEHGYFCPIAQRDTLLGTLLVSATVVLAAYRREEPSGDYVPTCCSPCTISPRAQHIGVTTPFVECGHIYVFSSPIPCSIGLCANQTSAGRCRPDTGSQPPNCQ